MQNAKVFDKMETLSKVMAPPPVKFKDLEEVVTHKITMNTMPFEAQVDFAKVTGDTVLVPVTVEIQNKDITFVEKDGVQRGSVIFSGELPESPDEWRRPLKTRCRLTFRRNCYNRRRIVPRVIGKSYRFVRVDIAWTSWSRM